jgi:DNA-binding LytR/AlgR family response regulator
MSQINTNVEVSLKNCSEEEKHSLTSVFQKVDFRFFSKELIIVSIGDDSEDNRLEVRKIINNHDAFLVLMSDSLQVAHFAWKCSADYFIYSSSDSWEKDLEVALKRILQHCKQELKNRITIKSHHRIDVIDPKEIVVIRALGNFSEIKLSDGQTIIASKALGVFEKEIENWTELKRFGRSIIINLKKIKNVKNKTITFSNNEQYSFPKYSRSFVFLKNCLLWNDY